ATMGSTIFPIPPERWEAQEHEADISWRFEDLWQSPIGDVSHASNFRTAVRCDLPNLSVPPIGNRMALLQQGADRFLVLGEVACDHAQFAGAERNRSVAADIQPHQPDFRRTAHPEAARQARHRY